MEMSKLGGVTLKLYVSFSPISLLCSPLFLLLLLLSLSHFFTIRQSGRTISVPYHDILTEWPSVGDVVTFTFDVTSHPDSPANPKIVRIRNDFHLPLFMVCRTKRGGK